MESKKTFVSASRGLGGMWTFDTPTVTNIVGDISVWSSATWSPMQFNYTEKPWYKLRCYANGFNGRDFPILPHGWSVLYHDHSKYCQNENVNISFWDWLKLQYPTARHIWDLQINTEGVSFETVEDKESFITWIMMKTINEP